MGGILERLKQKRRRKRIERIRACWRILKNTDANYGYRKKALKDLCEMANYSRLHIQEGMYDMVDITLSDGFEITGGNYFGKDALIDASREVIKYIMCKQGRMRWI